MTDQSTDLAVVERPPTPRNPGTITAGAKPQALIPQDFEGAWRIATAVCAAQMAPRGLDTPEKATVAILHGLEVGLTPMASLQSIAIVNGRPSIWGDGALALVRASGLLEDFEETVTGTGDAMVAKCWARRKGQKSAIFYEFGADDAKRAELWQTEPMVTRYKSGGSSYTVKNDSPWYRYARRMLQMRARAFVLRDGFADVLRGLHIREEQEDVVRASSSEQVAEAVAVPTRRAVPPPPADEPPAGEAAQEVAAANPETETVAEVVAEPEQEAVEAKEEAKPESDFPGDAKLPAGDAGPIPEKLRRRKPPTPEPVKEVSAEDEWVDGLDLAFSSCDDIDGLNDIYTRFLEPKLADFSTAAIERATAVYNKHADRVEQ